MRLVDGGVVLPVDEVAKRVANDRGLDQAGRELVQEWLEGVVVVPVDEHDVRVGVLQLLNGADAGEAAAEDDDARAMRIAFGCVVHGVETLLRRVDVRDRRQGDHDSESYKCGCVYKCVRLPLCNQIGDC